MVLSINLECKSEVASMKWKRKILRTIIQFLVLVLVAGYFTISLAEFTFAANTASPNVIVTIDGNGRMSQVGNLFSGGSLYPSSVSNAENGIGGIIGVIRLDNNYEKIDIENISIGLNSSKMEIGNNYPRDQVFNSFLDNIRLKIEKGRVLAFDKILVDYTSLRNLLFDSSKGEYSGYNLADENKFTLNKGDSIDLRYTLQMVEEAGNELQSVTAHMSIYINLQGNNTNGGGNGDNDNDNDNDNDGGGGNNDYENIIIPPIAIPQAQPQAGYNEEVIIEDLIPESQPKTNVEQAVEEDIEIKEEVPQGNPGSGLPKTGSANPFMGVGLGTIMLVLGFLLEKKK